MADYPPRLTPPALYPFTPSEPSADGVVAAGVGDGQGALPHAQLGAATAHRVTPLRDGGERFPSGVSNDERGACQ